MLNQELLSNTIKVDLTNTMLCLFFQIIKLLFLKTCYSIHCMYVHTFIYPKVTLSQFKFKPSSTRKKSVIFIFEGTLFTSLSNKLHSFFWEWMSYYWKCNFPLILRVCLLVGLFVGRFWLVGRIRYVKNVLIS